MYNMNRLKGFCWDLNGNLTLWQDIIAYSFLYFVAAKISQIVSLQQSNVTNDCLAQLLVTLSWVCTIAIEGLGLSVYCCLRRRKGDQVSGPLLYTRCLLSMLTYAWGLGTVFPTPIEYVNFESFWDRLAVDLSWSVGFWENGKDFSIG